MLYWVRDQFIFSYYLVFNRCVVSTICVCVAISFMLERSPEHFKDGVYDVDKIIGDVTKCAKLHIPQDGWVGAVKFLKIWTSKNY